MRKMLKFIKWFKERSSLAFRWWLSKQAKTSVICWFFPNLRSKIWKYCGVNIGKHVSIGWDVFLDVRYAHFLTIEDDVWITNRAIVFCHKRIMTDYHEGIRYKTLPQLPRETVIKKGALISTGAMVMPGVTVGEGAIVGAGALVAKDVPAWSLAVGVPAKVVKKFE